MWSELLQPITKINHTKKNWKIDCNKRTLKNQTPKLWNALICRSKDLNTNRHLVCALHTRCTIGQDKSNATDGTNYTEAMKVITLNYIYRFLYSHIFFRSFLFFSISLYQLYVRVRHNVLFYLYSVCLSRLLQYQYKHTTNLCVFAISSLFYAEYCIFYCFKKKENSMEWKKDERKRQQEIYISFTAVLNLKTLKK